MNCSLIKFRIYIRLHAITLGAFLGSSISRIDFAYAFAPLALGRSVIRIPIGHAIIAASSFADRADDPILKWGAHGLSGNLPMWPKRQPVVGLIAGISTRLADRAPVGMIRLVRLAE